MSNKKHKKHHSKAIKKIKKFKSSFKGKKTPKSHIKPAIRTDIRPKEIMKDLSAFIKLKINLLKKIIDSDMETTEVVAKPAKTVKTAVVEPVSTKTTVNKTTTTDTTAIKPTTIKTIPEEPEENNLTEKNAVVEYTPISQQIKNFLSEDKNIIKVNAALGVFLVVIIGVFIFSVHTMHRVNIAYDDVISQSEKISEKNDKLSEKYKKLKPKYDMLSEEYEKLNQSAEDAKNSDLTALEEETTQTTQTTEVAQ
jgi:cell division protein FtsB